MSTHRLAPLTIFAIALVLTFTGPAAYADQPQAHSQLTALLAQLPQKKRKILDDIMKRAERQNRGLGEEKRKLQAELDGLLEAPAFDQRTYLDKSAKLGTLRAKMCANLEDAIALAATQFTPQERIVLIRIHTLELEYGGLKEWIADDEEDEHKPPTE